jgi:hypothetical protein
MLDMAVRECKTTEGYSARLNENNETLSSLSPPAHELISLYKDVISLTMNKTNVSPASAGSSDIRQNIAGAPKERSRNIGPGFWVLPA